MARGGAATKRSYRRASAGQSPDRGEYKRATESYGEALALYRELGDECGVAFALNNLGVQEPEKGDYEDAPPVLEGALLLSRRLGDKRTIGYVLHNPCRFTSSSPLLSLYCPIVIGADEPAMNFGESLDEGC